MYALRSHTGSNGWVILYRTPAILLHGDNLVIEFSFHVDLQLVMGLIKEFVAESSVGVDYNRNRLQLERNRNCNRNQIFQIVA